MAYVSPVLFQFLLVTAYSVNSSEFAVKSVRKSINGTNLTCNETPLHVAVRSGDINAVNKLIQEGADIYAQDCSGLTPMHVAVLLETKSMVLTLVKNMFDVNKRFDKGRTVLAHAAVYGKIAPLQALVDFGAIVDAVSSEDLTPLYEAVVASRYDAARVLVSLGADPKKKLQAGDTYLHKAAAFDDFEAAHYFLTVGTPVDATNDKGETPMTRAVQRDNPAMVNLLVARGADAERSINGQTYLHTAAWNIRQRSLQALLEHGVLPDSKNSDGETPIILSVKRDDTRTAALLAEFGANLNQRGQYRMTLMHYAAKAGSAACIRWLVKRGQEVDSISDWNSTPLNWAADHGQLEAVKALVELGADVNYRKGDTALTQAKRHGYQDIVDYLRAHGGKE